MKSHRDGYLGFRFGLFLAVVVGLLLSAQVVLAYLEEITIGGFRVGLVSWDKNVPAAGQSTWTYEINGTPDTTNALSHWVLGTYCPSVSTSVLGATYTTSTGSDPSTASYGTKWDYVSGGAIASAGQVHTFTIVVNSLTSSTIPVTVKYGPTNAKGSIMGPYCGTTAVDLASLEGSSGAQVSIVVLAVGATIATAGVLRKGKKQS